MSISIFRVVYHAERNGKLDEAFGTHNEHIAAADGLPATLSGVLSSNARNVSRWGITIAFTVRDNTGSLS